MHNKRQEILITKNIMNNHFSWSSAIILVMTLGLLGCGASESIEPTWAPVPIDEQLKQKPLNVSVIAVDGLKVDAFGAEFGEVSELGPLFRELAGVFANVVLDEEGGQNYKIDPVIYFAPELDQIEDWSVVNQLSIKSFGLKINNAADYELASFEFIKELRIYLYFTMPGENQMDRQGQGILLASYDKEIDRENLGKLGRELELKIQDVDWKEILKTQRTFVIYTELVVDSVPPTDMDIIGNLGVSLGLRIGF
jgi:hypothetical protein